MLIAFAGCAERRTSETATSVALGPSTAEFESGVAPFLFELDSSRVAVTMMGVRGVIFHDFARQRADTIGRAGEGPGEFGRSSRITAWHDGRIAVMDPVLRRLTIMRTDGTVDTTVQYPSASLGYESVPTADGSVWYSEGERIAESDSAPFIRIGVGSRSLDTVAYLLRPRSQFIPLGRIAMNLPAEYAAKDVWGTFPNGSVWIARGADNRLDVIDTTGTLVHGTPRPFAEIRTVDADRHRVNGLPAPAILDTVKRAMAATKAPFQDVAATSNGELWFWLNQPAGYQQELYEVVAADGRVLGRVAVPYAHRVVYVGRESVFLYGENTEGVHVVTRHRRPILNR